MNPFSGACCFVTVLRSVSAVFLRHTLFHTITRSAPTMFCSRLQSPVSTRVTSVVKECGRRGGRLGEYDSLGTLLKIFCSTFFTGYPIQKLTLMFENRVSSLFQLFMCVGMFLYWFIKHFTEVDHWNPDEFVGP